MFRTWRLLALIPGTILLFLGVGIEVLVSVCPQPSDCAREGGSFGISAQGWGVILLLIGMVLLLADAYILRTPG